MLKALLTKRQSSRVEPIRWVCGVAHKYPLSDVGYDSDAQNVNIDVVGEIPRHPEPVSADSREVARNPRDNDVTHRVSITTSALV